jgi:hypothetical protein
MAANVTLIASPIIRRCSSPNCPWFFAELPWPITDHPPWFFAELPWPITDHLAALLGELPSAEGVSELPSAEGAGELACAEGVSGSRGAARRNRTFSGTAGPNGLRSAIVGPIRAGALARTEIGAGTPSVSDTRRP